MGGHLFEWKIGPLTEALVKNYDLLKSNGIWMDDPVQPRCPPCDDDLMECAICLDDLPAKDFLSPLPCGCQFSKNCWLDHISDAIQEGTAALKLVCPKYDCGTSILDKHVALIVRESNATENRKRELMERYNKFKHKTFIDLSSTLSYCPAANCDMITKWTSGMTREIVCPNVECKMKRWCWSCKLIGHLPSSCKDASQWLTKYNDEAETVKWVTANTKKCPKCNTPIEKNQGCMHMTCRSAIGCGYEFCWLCLGDWKTHGSNTGGYYKCTIYEEKKEKGEYDEKEAELDKVRSDLERYENYIRLYDAQLKGAEFAEKMIPRMKNTISGFRDADFSCLIDVLHEIAGNKRMCCWINVLLYWYPGDRTAARFSLLQ